MRKLSNIALFFLKVLRLMKDLDCLSTRIFLKVFIGIIRPVSFNRESKISDKHSQSDRIDRCLRTIKDFVGKVGLY